MEILHESENYRILISDREQHPYIIVYFEHWRSEFNAHTPSDFDSTNKFEFLTSKKCDFIAVQTRRNDWYQNDDIHQAMSIIKARKKGRIYIGFGNSMGGFAALALSEEYGADYVIATSPQASFQNDFIEKSKETRWKDSWQVFKNDLIRNGAARNTKCLIMVDPLMTIDFIHAKECAKHSQANIIFCHGTWHHTGTSVQRVHGLVRLMKDAGAIFSTKSEKDSSDVMREYIDALQEKLNSTNVVKFVLGTDDDRIAILSDAGIQEIAQSIEPRCLPALLKSSPTQKLASILLPVIMSSDHNDHRWKDARNEFSKTCIQNGFPEVIELTY